MNELYSGLFLMGIGMGTVFVFLVLLVLVTNTIYKLIGEAPAATSAPAAATAQSQTDDPTLIAVITAAITQHRNRTGNG